MSTLILFTGNKRKIAEAKTVFDEYAITFKAFSASIDEIQHRDPTEIAKAKARAAYEVVKKPLVINDSSWSIPSLGGFPGGYMKDVNEWFGVSDWLKLLEDKDDRSITLHERTVYYDGAEMVVFESTYAGVFIDEPRGEWHRGSMEQLVSVYDGKTIAENRDDETVGASMKHVEHWREFAEWYTNGV